MAIVPENTSDTAINQMWDQESPMSDDDKIAKLFGHELKHAEAVQAAMNRIERLMHQEMDLRGRGFELSWDYNPNAPIDERHTVIDLNTYCGAPGTEAPMNFIGKGRDRPAALQSLCDQYDDYDERPKRKVSRVVHSSPFEPPTYAGDWRDDDVDFDSGLTDDDAR